MHTHPLVHTTPRWLFPTRPRFAGTGVLLLIAGMLLAACNLDGSTVGTATPSEKTVIMGRATWETGWFQAEIFRVLLQELGYTVPEPVTLAPEAFYPAAASGEYHLWANGWFPLHYAYLEDDEVQGKLQLVGYQARAGALQGYLIDKKTADELGITNLGALRDPEIAAVFDRDGNGKADLIGCEPDWGCARVVEHHLNVYDLRETVEHRQGPYDASMLEVIERYQQGEPVLYQTWTPNWTITRLVPGEDVVWLEVPFASLPAEQRAMESLTTLDGLRGCVADPCLIGWPPNDIRAVANSDFLRDHPAVRRLLEQVQIPLEDIASQNALMFAGEDRPVDIQRHAREWMMQHQAQVDQWLAEARDAAAE